MFGNFGPAIAWRVTVTSALRQKQSNEQYMTQTKPQTHIGYRAEMLSPRGQNFGLGLTVSGLETLASRHLGGSLGLKVRFRPRPRNAV